MIEDIFLARTEEQQQFRQMLKAVLPIGLRKHMPTFSRLLPQAEPDAHASILLFYGAGGMGKTSLTRKLLQLATQDKAFKGNLNTLHLDWENEQKLTPGLNVGHDFIEPETVLNVLHRALVKAGWGGGVGEYDKAVRELRSAESMVETALQRQPESTRVIASNLV